MTMVVVVFMLEDSSNVVLAGARAKGGVDLVQFPGFRVDLNFSTSEI